jgi:glycosyltransferase involved in cell wall biosynthesis
MLRIAVVTETWPPEVNGVARTAARLAEGLQERGHDLQLVRLRQGPADRARAHEVLMRGVPIPHYPNLRLGLPGTGALMRLWQSRRPDVVHLITEGPLGWSALAAAERLGLPVVSDFRTNFHDYCTHYGMGWLKAPILAYLRHVHNRTVATLVPTEPMRARLAGLGFRGLRVLGRGVDTALFDPARRDAALRAQWGAGPDDVVVLYVGRLAAEKNLAALPLLPGARLVFVGDGPLRAKLAERFPRAVFAGTRTGADLAAHYASADLFLFPSLTETWGNVTLEAMASGLAVVAYDYAGAAAVMCHGVNGVLVPFGDGAAFGAQARNLAANLRRLRQLGANARRQAQGLGWDQLAAELEAVLVGAARAVRGQASTNEAAAIAAPSAAPASTSLG